MVRWHQTDNIKTSFMNNISHRLRAPLQNIIGFSELIEETHNNSVMDQQISDYIKDIKNLVMDYTIKLIKYLKLPHSDQAI